MVSRTAWARAGPTRAPGPYGLIWVNMSPYGFNMGPIWANMGPYGPFWAQKGPVLTNHLLTYHVTAPDTMGPWDPIITT